LNKRNGRNVSMFSFKKLVDTGHKYDFVR